MGGQGDLGTLLVRLQADASQYVKTLEDAEKQAKLTSGNLAAMFAKGAAAMAGSMASLGAVALREYGKFDKAMTESVSIMTGVNATLRRDMEVTARQLATEGVQSAEELARSYYYLASAGLDAKASMAALPVVQKFATAGAFDMARATDLLTDAQSALGMVSKDSAVNMQQMAELGDVLVKANTLANASVEQFSTALTTKAGAAMRLLNMDITEGVAVLAAFADQGIKAELAGEKFAIVVRDLQTSARKMPAAWDAMGLAAFDATGNLRPMADIVEDMEKRFDGMSDKTISATFAMLGFQDRSVQAIQTLLGTSEKIRGYERALKDAGGTAQEVADKQMEAFFNQLNTINNIAKDVLITIGEGLIPIVSALGRSFIDSADATQNFQSQIRTVSEYMQTGLLTSMMVVSDVIAGWKILIKGGEIALLSMGWVLTRAIEGWGMIASSTGQAFIGLATLIERVFDGVLSVVESTVKRVISGLNWMIDSANKIPGVDIEYLLFGGFGNEDGSIAAGWLEKARKELEGIQHNIDEKGWSDSYATAIKQATEEMGALVDEGRPSVEILENFVSRMKEINEEAAKGGLGSVASQMAGIERPAWMVMADQWGAKNSPSLPQKMPEAPTWMDMADQWGDKDSPLAPEGMPSGFTPPPMPRMDFGVLGGFGGEAEDPFAQQGSGTFANEAEQSDSQLETLQRHYEAAREMILKETELTGEQRATLEKKLDEELTKQRDIYMKQRNQLQLDQLSTVTNQALNMLEQFGMEQSGLYKGIFLMQQTLLAVQTIMNAEAAAAQALLLWGHAGPVMSGVIRAMGYASAGVILGQAFASFEGGGYTGDGSRSGGMDGKGGFLAMLHPQERVVDEYKDGPVGGGVNVVVNNNVQGAEVQVVDDGRNLEILIQAVENHLVSGVRTGASPFSKAMERTYSMSRGGRR